MTGITARSLAPYLGDMAPPTQMDLDRLRELAGRIRSTWWNQQPESDMTDLKWRIGADLSAVPAGFEWVTNLLPRGLVEDPFVPPVKGDHFTGPPVATSHRTVEQLERQKAVGLYRRLDPAAPVPDGWRPGVHEYVDVG